MSIEVRGVDDFTEMVADRLIELILIDELPVLIEERVKDHLLRKKPKDFVANNEKYVVKYRTLLRKRFGEMEKEVLAKIKPPPKSVYHADRDYWIAKEKFDVNEWMFNRKKWYGTLTKDGKLMAAKPLAEGGQAALDDLGVGITFDQQDSRVLTWIATNAKRAGWAITNTVYERLRKQLLEAVADGESIPKIRERVKEVFGDISKHRSELIARTETLKASNRGLVEGMKQSGVVEGKQWLATMDARTCPECEEMDGATMPLDEPFFKEGEEHTFDTGKTMVFDYEEIVHPPLHPDCRCTLLAIVKEV